MPLPTAAAPDPTLLAALLPALAPPPPIPLPTGGPSTADAGALAASGVATAIIADPVAVDPTASLATSASVAALAPATTTPRDLSSAPPPAAPSAAVPASALPGDPSVAPAAPAAAAPLPPTIPPALPPALSPATAVVAIAAALPLTGATIGTAPPTPVDTASEPPPAPIPVPGAIQIDARSAPVVALSTAAPPAPLQGTAAGAATTSAIQAFGSAMRAGLAKDPRLDAATDGTTTTLPPRRDEGRPGACGRCGRVVRSRRRWTCAATMAKRDDRPYRGAARRADATSTKIRVVPMRSAPVEMSVRKDGDTLHVHFTADQAATRAILTEAQPRLPRSPNSAACDWAAARSTAAARAPVRASSNRPRRDSRQWPRLLPLPSRR